MNAWRSKPVNNKWKIWVYWKIYLNLIEISTQDGTNQSMVFYSFPLIEYFVFLSFLVLFIDVLFIASILSITVLNVHLSLLFYLLFMLWQYQDASHNTRDLTEERNHSPSSLDHRSSWHDTAHIFFVIHGNKHHSAN